MRRTIEKLSQQRKEKQDALTKEIEGLKKQSQELSSSDSIIRLQHLLSRMQELLLDDILGVGLVVCGDGSAHRRRLDELRSSPYD